MLCNLPLSADQNQTPLSWLYPYHHDNRYAYLAAIKPSLPSLKNFAIIEEYLKIDRSETAPNWKLRGNTERSSI